MAMKTAIATLLALAIIIASFFYMRGKPANCIEVNPEKQLGEGGELVRSVFHAWSFGNFDEVFSKITNGDPAEKTAFIRAMKHTAIHWQNLEIVSEERTETGWKVALKLDITTPTSAFATFVMNAKFPGNPMGSETGKRMKAHEMGIEKLASIKQTWTVIQKDGKLLVDMRAKKIPGDTYPLNVLNYAADASLIDNLPSTDGPALSMEQQGEIAAPWLAKVSVDVGLTLEDTMLTMVNASKLVRQAAAEYNQIARELREQKNAP
jgi:hypothetical protein